MSNNTNKSNIGHTIFKPTGVRYKYPLIDLVKQQVTCAVVYEENIYMTVVVDVKNNTVSIQGNAGELVDLSMSKDDTIDMFKHQAKFFIDNNVSDPDKYFDELIRNPTSN